MRDTYIKNVRIVWREPEVFYVLNDPAGHVGRYMFGIGLRMQAAARMEAPKRTGALALSIRMKQESSPRGQLLRLGSSLPYAYMAHEGTKPHIIRGRNGGMLRFTRGTRVIYDREVLHPGTRGNKFLSRQLYMVKSTGRFSNAITVSGTRI